MHLTRDVILGVVVTNLALKDVEEALVVAVRMVTDAQTGFHVGVVDRYEGSYLAELNERTHTFDRYKAWRTEVVLVEPGEG
jgi:hypothetical protein